MTGRCDWIGVGIGVSIPYSPRFAANHQGRTFPIADWSLRPARAPGASRHCLPGASLANNLAGSPGRRAACLPSSLDRVARQSMRCHR